MHYQISRNGQTYGPYTLEDLQRYLTTGNVLATDLAKSDAMLEWIPVSQLMAQHAAGSGAGSAAFGAAGTEQIPYASVPAGYSNTPMQAMPMNSAAAAASQYPDPPNLHWGLVLLFAVFTCGLFVYVWDLVQSSWMKRVQPNSTALYYYIAASVLAVLSSGARFSYGFQTNHVDGRGAVLSVALVVVLLVARFSMRSSLEEHFNTVEPIGLQLSGIMTFFFGTLYFQYHFNRINRMKQAARYGGVRPY